jgi:hypothetical protein
VHRAVADPGDGSLPEALMLWTILIVILVVVLILFLVGRLR